MVDIAQAGVIRVPLERQGAEFDTPIWLPWTDDLTEQLPFPPPPAKKRSSTSKSKSKTLKGPGPASVWMVPAKQVVNAISILHQDQWAEFHYIIQNDVLYIRVGIFLLPDYELRGDRTYSHLTQAKKTMLLLLRAWEWEDVAAMDWSDGVIPPLVMIDKVSRRIDVGCFNVLIRQPNPRRSGSSYAIRNLSVSPFASHLQPRQRATGSSRSSDYRRARQYGWCYNAQIL